MPWKETNVMELKTEFVLRSLIESIPFRTLCQEYGISPKTGYKWRQRFRESGIEGLHELSRRPLNSPNKLDEDTICEIVKIKESHRGWGARKLLKVYTRKKSDIRPPSESSVQRILTKCGLVQKRKIRSSDKCGRIQNRIKPKAPNDLWTVDFKGWWYTKGGDRCEPLTVRDDFSCFLLCVEAVENARTETIKAHFERIFTIYGLPKVIRSDNGSPFAGRRSPLGFSRLSAWWVALGISLDRNRPGHPQDNHRHERMHQDISKEVEHAIKGDLKTYQAELAAWQNIFNWDRPHESLQMKVPGEVYQKSTRLFKGTPEKLEYPGGYVVRKVDCNGCINVDTAVIRIGSAFRGWDVGLKPIAPVNFVVWFGDIRLGHLNLETESFNPADSILDVQSSLLEEHNNLV